MNQSTIQPMRNEPSTMSRCALQKVAILGNYPPRRCGIATFTSDLTQAISGQEPGVQVDVVAMSDRRGYKYSSRVRHEIPFDDKHAYRFAAEFLNTGSYDLLSIQHEYGIFGGQCGGYLLALLQGVNMPIVTTLHTVLQDPSATQKAVTSELLSLSARVVVMSALAAKILADVYGVSVETVDFIPHGIPDFSLAGINSVKSQLGIKGSMILTFGLLSPDKGIQYVIKAMPQILAIDPDAVYVVLGATHPKIQAESGEAYRESLVSLARELGVQDKVLFIDRFVDQCELVEYLQAADVYITPYLNPRQITSGTLAYALGAGKAVISTPYLYAQELLAEGRGILVPFRNVDEITAAFTQLMANDGIARQMRRKGAQYCESMQWPAVGNQYLQSLSSTLKTQATRLAASNDRFGEKFGRSLVRGNHRGHERTGAEMTNHLSGDGPRIL